MIALPFPARRLLTYLLPGTTSGLTPQPGTISQEGQSMQAHLDLDAPAHTPPAEPLPHAPDDTGVHDLADLWLDLGGGG